MDSISILKGPITPLTPKTIHKIFEDVAKTKAANNSALIFEETTRCTYKELDDLSNSFSKIIRETILDNNLPKNNDGDLIIAVSLHPSDHLITILLAIWKAGAAYLPLDPNFPQNRVEHILKEAKPLMVIFKTDMACFDQTYRMPLDKLLHSSSNKSNDSKLEGTNNDLAIVLYTSGSTGMPKGVRLSHGTILNRLQWQFKTFPYGKSETMAVFKTALTFVDSICEIWGPLLKGLSLVVVPKAVVQNPEALVATLDKYKIERLVLVPSLLTSLLTYLNLKRSKLLLNLRICICSGEVLPISLVKKFYEYFPNNQHQLCNFYGSTEVMGDVTFHVLTGEESKVPIGLPIDNTAIYLLNSDLSPVKIGEIGEIFVSGLNLAKGYVGDSNSQKFLKTPFDDAQLYRTGDFACIENGILMYEGRIDSQVKISGHRIDLSEIQKVIGAIDGVIDVAVLCHTKSATVNQIVAFITTRTLSEEKIVEVAKTNLLPYMVPRVVLVDHIPLLVNGKVDRQTLLSCYKSLCCNNKDFDYTGVSDDKMEAAKTLFEIVASLANTKTVISTTTNFYAIGGNSLNSIFTIAKLSQAGLYIGINNFISAKHLGEIIDLISYDELSYESKIAQNVRYIAEELNEEHKLDVIDMITTSFYNKSPLDLCMQSELSGPDYREMVDKLWPTLLEQDLSFIVKTESNQIIGVALNHDVREEPKMQLNSKIQIINDFTGHVEKPAKDALPLEKGKSVYSAWTGTKSTLTPQDNVAVFQFIEEETLRLAKRKGFIGVLSNNVNELTQQLATDIYGYETHIEYQINQYVAGDGTRPFHMAPDSQKVLVQWKSV